MYYKKAINKLREKGCFFINTAMSEVRQPVFSDTMNIFLLMKSILN